MLPKAKENDSGMKCKLAWLSSVCISKAQEQLQISQINVFKLEVLCSSQYELLCVSLLLFGVVCKDVKYAAVIVKNSQIC